MKWGIRRYQNKDGTLTKAGKKRYNTINTINSKRLEKLLNKFEAIKKNGILRYGAKKYTTFSGSTSTIYGSNANGSYEFRSHESRFYITKSDKSTHDAPAWIYVIKLRKEVHT